MNCYLLFAGIGALAATIVYVFSVKRQGYPVGLSCFAAAASVTGLFAGARMFGYISARLYYIDTGVEILPGIVFYGGLFGFLAVFLLLQKVMLGGFASGLCDSAGIMIPLFHMFGRIGCFCSGCCAGFLGNIPVQLAESFGNFVIFAVLLVLFLQRKCHGKLLVIYLVSYAVLRFFLEFFREDIERGMVGVFSFGQICSILLIVFLAGLHYGKKRI